MTNQTITKSIKTKFLAIAMLFLSILGLNLALSTPFYTENVYAANICQQEGVTEEIKKANGCGEDNPENLQNVIVGAVNGVVGILALVAVIFVLIGGINYITSAGDPSKVKKAKETILYALIGLAVAVLSFAIVNFVIVKVLSNN
ncbi:MAG: pilin [Candidatus Saccharibacteria bacterium]|nr:pilin [Candidatus Saccharibacteria bacterium]